MVGERFGLGVIHAAGWSATDIQDVARGAEAAGVDALCTTEVNNGALATAQLMGTATRRIQVGTCTANIYLRHAYVCTQGAALIAEVTGGLVLAWLRLFGSFVFAWGCILWLAPC
jgi:alkanesulfonate monooxygenase SsuD/methylene tetrahydromethanopterin reductase-like flavin-dependent oxidoreductase (luciferase family)